jgi:hypothetical protein
MRSRINQSSIIAIDSSSNINNNNNKEGLRAFYKISLQKLFINILEY